MLILDTNEVNTLYYSVDENRYDDDLNSFETGAVEVGNNFYSISLYMRDYYAEVTAIIYDAIKGTTEEVVGYVSKESRGVLKLFLDYEFTDNKSYNIEVISTSGELLYRGNIITGNDYLDIDENNDLIRY